MQIYLVMKRDRPFLQSYYPYKAFVDHKKAEALYDELTTKLFGRKSYVKIVELVDKGDESWNFDG